jgi:hypothetical protein
VSPHTVKLVDVKSMVTIKDILICAENISLALTETALGKNGPWFTDALYAYTGNNLTAINIWAVDNCVYGLVLASIYLLNKNVKNLHVSL